MLTVSYPGAEGSFSQQAARAFFGCAALRGFESWEDAARAVAEGRADYGVFPVENSNAGSVPLSFELMDRFGLRIVGERQVRIVHHLLGVPGASVEDIRVVRSHPQAIAQCGDFLARHPQWQVRPSPNTALSAREVAQAGDPTQAAIASQEAADAFGLCVLAAHIQSSQANATRFAAVSRQGIPLCAPNKATVFFIVENQVGALCRVLTCFAHYQLNMSRIESRPLKDRPFEYYFLADFEGAMDEAHLSRALADCRDATRELRLLGIYGKED